MKGCFRSNTSNTIPIRPGRFIMISLLELYWKYWIQYREVPKQRISQTYSENLQSSIFNLRDVQYSSNTSTIIHHDLCVGILLDVLGPIRRSPNQRFPLKFSENLQSSISQSGSDTSSTIPIHAIMLRTNWCGMDI